jgi:hypothetical protein
LVSCDILAKLRKFLWYVISLSVDDYLMANLILCIFSILILFAENVSCQILNSGDVTAEWENDFNFPPQDSQGWSILTPSSDSRLIYVSSSEGDDAQGVIYDRSNVLVGSDPFNPSAGIKAYSTISHALTLVRSDYPDWVLLKRGDVWTETEVIYLKSGRSVSERSVLAYYGNNTERPLIKTGTGGGLRFWKSVSYVAVLGLKLYAHGRDPGSPDFAGFGSIPGATGFYSYASEEPANRSILIEDSVFSFYSNNIAQGPLANEDIIIRRCQFLDNYSESSHSQGMYTKHASIYLEENLFDHNGWYKQSYVSLNDQAEGQATFFNHNTYFTETDNTIFKRNLFLRASSIGNKFTANSPEGGDEITARNVLVNNNTFVRGEIGISMGGNNDRGTGYRWRDMNIVNNVFLDIGADRPTDRTLAWGIDADDWDGGRISGNYLIHYGNAEVRNIYGINFGEHSRNVDINSNIFYRLSASQFALQVRGQEPKENIRIFDNKFQLQETDLQLIRTEYLSPGTFFNNFYMTARDSDSWFRIQENNVDFNTWVQEAGDTNSKVEQLVFPDPNRTIETYQQSLGKTGTLAAFIEEARQQSKFNWRSHYTAGAVNAYIRAGFGVEDNSVPQRPGNLKLK